MPKVSINDIYGDSPVFQGKNGKRSGAFPGFHASRVYEKDAIELIYRGNVSMSIENDSRIDLFSPSEQTFKSVLHLEKVAVGDEQSDARDGRQ